MGRTENFYNRIFAVTEVVGLNEFKVNIGLSTETPTISGTLCGYYVGQSAQSGTFALYDENFGGKAATTIMLVSVLFCQLPLVHPVSIRLVLKM